MKTASAKKRSSMKSGSVSLPEARAAARIAKAARPVGADARGSAVSESQAWALYLGHFGPAAKKSVATKSAAKKGARKKVTSTSRKTAAKKAPSGKKR